MRRRAAELGQRDDQRVFEQAALLQVVEQRRHDVIQLGDQLLMRLEVLAVAVPPGPADADERHARLDQPAGDQRLLAELRRAVGVADLLRLLRRCRTASRWPSGRARAGTPRCGCRGCCDAMRPRANCLLSRSRSSPRCWWSSSLMPSSRRMFSGIMLVYSSIGA